MATLEADDLVLGVIGLGSTSGGARRPDEWSDHDLWVVSRPGEAEWFRTHPDWLPDPERIVLFFRETAHGVGVLYDRGHLVEFAVFEPGELTVARANDFAVLLDRERIAGRMADIREVTEASSGADPAAHAGRFLTAIVVAVGRHRRGERLSGREFLTGVAVARLLRLAALIDTPAERVGDDLDPRRRVERTQPGLADAVGYALMAPTEEAAAMLLETSVSLLRTAGTRDRAITTVRSVVGLRNGPPDE